MNVLLYTISSRRTVGGAENVRDAVGDGLRARGHTVTTVFTEPETDLAETDWGRWALRVSGVSTRWKVPTPSMLTGAAGSL